MDSRADPVVSGNTKGPAETLYAQNQGLIGATLSRGFSGLSPTQRETAETYASLGLWHAACRFDPQRGYQFSTFAVHSIRGYILRGLKRERDQESLPCVSLDAPFAGNLAGRDVLADAPEGRPGMAILAEAGFEALVQPLPPRLETVIRRVYEDGVTVSELAGEWGVSRSAVSSLHVRALKQMRQRLGCQ